jgi:hypothetical protein
MSGAALMSNMCKIVDNAVPSDICKNAISLYEARNDLHDRRGNEETVSFTTLNINKHKSIPEVNLLRDRMLGIAQSQVFWYKTNVPEADIGFPRNFIYEEFRMKRYTQGKDRFNTHVDASNLDNCRRFFMLLFYLNDVEEGGETEFPLIGFKSKPKQGRLLMFPPLWTYPHKANIPKSGPKYTFEIYLHYTR